MKNLFLLITIFLSIADTSTGQIESEVEAQILRSEFNSIREEFEVVYEIVDYGEDNLYLIEIEYLDYDLGNIIFPAEGSISGDAGMYAIRGGGDKKFIWDFKLQGEEVLGEGGEFRIDVIQVKKSESAKLFRAYKRQYEIKSKLEKNNLKSGRKKRLTRRLERITEIAGRTGRNSPNGYYRSSSQNRNVYEKEPEPPRYGALTIYSECSRCPDIDIAVNGKYWGTLRHKFYRRPDCGEEGTITKKVPPGKYHIQGRNRYNRSWDKGVVVEVREGICTPLPVR